MVAQCGKEFAAWPKGAYSHPSILLHSFCIVSVWALSTAFSLRIFVFCAVNSGQHYTYEDQFHYNSAGHIIMPYKLSNPPSPPSFLSVTQPEAVPHIDTLEHWRDALEKLKSKHIERLGHAVENLRASDDELRRIKDREKGKSKVLEKIKRERDCAFVLITSWLLSRLLSAILPAFIISSHSLT